MTKTTWTEFWDMNGGGAQKTMYAKIYIEAEDEEHAIETFHCLFGVDPTHTTCDCCGPDYSICTENRLIEHFEDEGSERDLIKHLTQPYCEEKTVFIPYEHPLDPVHDHEPVHESLRTRYENYRSFSTDNPLKTYDEWLES